MNEPSPQPKEAPTVAPSTPQRATQPAPQFIERVTHRLSEATEREVGMPSLFDLLDALQPAMAATGEDRSVTEGSG